MHPETPDHSTQSPPGPNVAGRHTTAASAAPSLWTTPYWLAIWLLSPTRGAVLLKCVFIGIVLKLLSFVLAIPLLALDHDTYDPTEPSSPLHDVYTTAIGAIDGIVFAPLIETAAMALVFGLLGFLPRRPYLLPGAVIVAAAIFLHHDDLLTQSFVAFMFMAFSVQYALFRAHFSASMTIFGVALTHATVNTVGILIGRALMT